MRPPVEILRPTGMGWKRAGTGVPSNPFAEIYAHLDGRLAISAVEIIREGDDSRWEYHVSVSWNGGRASPEQAQATVRDFAGLLAPQFEEDNHAPHGRVRNFWCAVDPSRRKPCPCFETEKPIVEGDYTWREAPR